MSTEADEDFNTFQASMIKPTTKMSKRMMKAYQLGPSDHVQPEQQSNSPSKKAEGDVTFTLSPANQDFEFRSIAMFKDVPVKIARLTNPKQPPAVDNLIFDSKVLSRTHAELVFDGTSVTIKDLGSSNGTFVNGNRLSPEGSASTEGHLLKNGDVLQLGVDILDEDGVTLLYHRVTCNVGVLGLKDKSPEAVPSSAVSSSATDSGTSTGDVLAILKGELDSVQRQSQTITKLKLQQSLQPLDGSSDGESAAKLSQLQASVDALGSENQALAAKLKSAETQIDQLKSKAESYQDLESQVQALVKDKAALQQQLENALQQASKNQASSDASKQLVDIQQQLDKTTTAANKAQEEHDTRLRSLQSELQQAQQEVKQLQQKVQETHSAIQAKQLESDAEQSLKIVALQNQCQQLQEELAQSRSQDQTQKQHSDELAALQGLVDLKEKELTSLQKKLNIYKTQDQELIDLRKQLNAKKDVVQSPQGISVVAVVLVAVLSAVLSYVATNYELVLEEMLKLMPKQ